MIWRYAHGSAIRSKTRSACSIP